MKRSAKVAISLPESVLKSIEKERKASGESRSEFFRRAAEELLKKEKEAEAVQQYIRGYSEIPETLEEVESIHQTAIETLSKEPW